MATTYRKWARKVKTGSVKSPFQKKKAVVRKRKVVLKKAKPLTLAEARKQLNFLKATYTELLTVNRALTDDNAEFQRSNVTLRQKNVVLVSHNTRLHGEKTKLMLDRGMTLDTYLWRTAGDVPTKLSDMDEGHLRNTLSLTIRRLTNVLNREAYTDVGFDYVEALYFIFQECKRRGWRV